MPHWLIGHDPKVKLVGHSMGCREVFQGHLSPPSRVFLMISKKESTTSADLVL